MIWLWISITILAISILFFIFKIPFQFLFIALIPIQRYGFHLFGLNVKPFHVFALFLLVYIIVKYKKETLHIVTKKPFIPFLIVLLLFSMVFVNLINGGGMSSLKYVGVVFLTIFSCFIFVISVEGVENRLPILFKSVVISSTVFSAFFLLACLLFKFNLTLPETVIDMVADSESTRGIATFYHNGSASAQRTQMRIIGFAVDPNAFSVTLLPPICILLNKLCVYKNRIKEAIPRLICLAIIIGCLILTQSRTAWFLLAWIIFIFVVWFLITKEYSLVVKLSVIIVIVVAIAGLEIYFKGRLFSEFIKIIYSRSFLTGNDGRLTLWGSSITTLFKNNPIFGLGLGVFSNDAGLEAHNTWLEYYAGCGLIVGLLSSLIFGYAFYTLYIKANIYSYDYKINDGWGVFFNLLAVSAALMFISYIASPDFWLYFAIAARFDMLLPKEHQEKLKSRVFHINLSDIQN